MRKSFFCFLIFWTLAVMVSPIEAPAEKSKPAAKGKEEVIPVKAMRVAPVSKTFVRRLPATLMTGVETRLAFRVSGRISSLPVEVGQVVKKGKLIGLLDPRDFEDALGEAQAALARAVARQEDAVLHLKRMEKLWSDQDVDINDLDRSRAGARSAEDQVKIQKRQLNEARRRLAYTRLKAPYTGVIAQKQVNVFDTVAADQAVVLFVDLSCLKARAQLSPSLMPQHKRFEKYSVVIPALNGLSLPATFEGIGPSALPPHRTCPITVILSPPPGTPILPGMEGILNITVTNPDQDNFILVPASAVVSDYKGQSRVWIVNPNTGETQPRTVAVEGLHHGKIALKSGINTGEWVITAGQNRLSPGRKVRIVQPVDAGK